MTSSPQADIAAKMPLAKDLEEDLIHERIECIICAENVLRQDPLWFCRTCFGVLHLQCVSFWARSESKGANQFRCPLCRSACISTTLEPKCFCGKTREPPPSTSLVPGTCGNLCEKKRPGGHCEHLCPLKCHAGPCPPCLQFRQQSCHCGSSEKTVGCSAVEGEYSCDRVCGKELNCGRHYCANVCHSGPCPNCSVIVPNVPCFCGQTKRDFTCRQVLEFNCQNLCGKILNCGNHPCSVLCHEGDCQKCDRDVSRTLCACGKSSTGSIQGGGVAQRQSCLDSLFVCNETCSRLLCCGQHRCQQKCHDSPCPPCALTTQVACRCGGQKTTVPCFVTFVKIQQKPRSDDDHNDTTGTVEYDRTLWLAMCEQLNVSKKLLPKAPLPILCQRRCKEKMSCKKHQCDRVCCDDQDHICLKICRKKASCGLHECGQLCHSGLCPPCSNISFDSLYCRCRRSVIEAPVPCGTLPPRCNHPCPLPRPCGHPSNHTCHQGECPPCLIPVPKLCGSHGAPMDYHIPCHIPDVSCGRTCKKPLPCCGILCQLPCHGGPCLQTKHVCKGK